MATRKPQPVTVTKSELAFLNAMIEFARESEKGKAETVTIHLDPQMRAIWTGALVKAGKWAWANRYKLLAVTEAAWDLIGGSIFRQDDKESLKAIQAIARRDLPLKDLIEARDTIVREAGAQGKKDWKA